MRRLGGLFPAVCRAHVARHRSRPLDLAYYTLVVTQQALFNAVFHSTAAVAFRKYSRETMTAPLWHRLTRAALTEARLSGRDVAVRTVVAGLVHGVVARQVFFVGVPEKR